MRARQLFKMKPKEIYDYFSGYDIDGEYKRCWRKVYSGTMEERLFDLLGYWKPLKRKVIKKLPILDFPQQKDRKPRYIKFYLRGVSIFVIINQETGKVSSVKINEKTYRPKKKKI